MLKAGFAKVDITPESHRQTIYHRFGPLDDVRTPIRDRLYARAAAFRQAERLTIWIAADVLCVDTSLRNTVVAELAREGISPQHVVLCATHTHTAPSVVHFYGVEPTPPEYRAYLAARMVDAARAAMRHAKRARISFGKTTVDLSVNRRQIGRLSQINDLHSPAGLVDPEVAVARIQFDGGGTAVLFNYAAHPLTMSRNTPLISADYPGRAAEHLETQAGMIHAQFLQGCAGNANIKVHGDEPEALLAGGLLAEAVQAAAAASCPSSTSDVVMVAETVRLPWGKMATGEEAQAALDREQSGQRPPDRRKVEWAQAVLRAYESGPIAPYAEVLVQAMRVGDGVFVALPGEVFLEIGLTIKRLAAVENLFVVAYCNNCEVGYIPTAAAFAEGGYEIDVAPFYYGLFQLSPVCEQILRETAVQAVRKVL